MRLLWILQPLHDSSHFPEAEINWTPQLFSSWTGRRGTESRSSYETSFCHLWQFRLLWNQSGFFVVFFCQLTRLKVIRKSMRLRDQKRELEKAHIVTLQALVKLSYPRFIAYWSLGPGSFSRRGKKKKYCPKSHFPFCQNECNFLSLKLSHIAEHNPCLINSVQFRVLSRRCIIAALQWIMKASHMHLPKLKIWPFAEVWDEVKSLERPDCVIMFSFDFRFLKAVPVEIPERHRKIVSADITVV